MFDAKAKTIFSYSCESSSKILSKHFEAESTSPFSSLSYSYSTEHKFSNSKVTIFYPFIPVI